MVIFDFETVKIHKNKIKELLHLKNPKRLTNDIIVNCGKIISLTYFLIFIKKFKFNKLDF